MSSDRYVVKVGVKDRDFGFDLYGASAVIVSGSLSLTHHRRGERLMTEGVNSQRSRVLHLQPPDLVLDICEPLPIGMDLAARETEYAGAEWRLCTLMTLFGGGTHTWKNAVIESCEIVLRGFDYTGAGMIVGSSRTLVARWSFIRQQEADS